MPITRTALIDDDGTGTTGTVLNNAWYQSFCDAIDALAASSGVWNSFTPTLTVSGTGSAAVASTSACAFTVIGKTLFVSVNFTVTVTGTPTAILLTLPGGYTANRTLTNVGLAHTYASPLFLLASGTQLQIYRDQNATLWTAGSPVIGFTATMSVT